jgi:hypothetical protein
MNTHIGVQKEEDLTPGLAGSEIARARGTGAPAGGKHRRAIPPGYLD